MSSPTLRILRRSLRLPQLKQGGTLSISASRLLPDLDPAPAAANHQPADKPSTRTRSSAASRPPARVRLPPLTVRIVPGWRDDAEIELWQQIFVRPAPDLGGKGGTGGTGNAANAAKGGEEGRSNGRITDDFVVGLSARIGANGVDEQHQSTTGTSSDTSGSSSSTDSAPLHALGGLSGDVSLHLDLASALQQSSMPDDGQSLAEEMDVHDMEIPVELDEGDEDDENDFIEENIFSTIAGSSEIGEDEIAKDDGNSNNNNDSSDHQDGIDDIFECSDDDDDGLNSLTLIANVPEKVNLHCHLEGEGNIIVEGKLEGQHGFDLHVAKGNIKVKKLRGDSVRLFAGNGTTSDDSSSSSSSSSSRSSDRTKEVRRPTGIVYATDLVEAQSVSIQAEGRMRAKMVNGTDIHLSIGNDHSEKQEDDGKSKIITTTTTTTTTTTYNAPLEVDDTGALIDIGSLYTTKNGNGANIEVLGSAGDKVGSADIPRAVRVKSSHGHLSVTSALCKSAIENNVDEFDQAIPIVELGGVNGSCDVIINTAREGASAPSLLKRSKDKNEEECVAARVHVDSLTPDSVSFVSAAYGNVELTVDRKVEADLRLVSSPNVSHADAEALLVDDEDGVRKECERLDNLSSASTTAGNDPTSVITDTHSNRIYVQTNSFTQNHSETLANGTEYVEGMCHNRSFEPDSRFDVKTKHTSATGTADINKGVGKVNIMGAAAQALAGFSGKKGGEQSPLFAVASSRSIKVETVSWFGAIARRYGMEDRRQDVGRTASREGRLK